MNNLKLKLIVVIPCYNEQEVLPIIVPMILNKLNGLINNNLISLGVI